MQNSQSNGIRLCAVAKSYGATVALESVTMTLQPGRVHAILGENGAGKSTLVKVLSGVVSPNAGKIIMEGREYAPRSLLHARTLGVSTAFQELSLIPNLSVAQNFYLPHALKNAVGLPAKNSMRRETLAILARHDIHDIPADADVASLSLAGRQRVEIVRAMHLRPKLLILDEPTGALTDVEWLFRLIHRLTVQGTAVLYISHRLAEIREIATHATVLRSGNSIATMDLDEVGNEDIFELMVGRRASQTTRVSAAKRPAQRPCMLANDICGPGFRDVSFELRDGEILGLAGLEGQGQRELFRALAGIAGTSGGQILLGDKEVVLRSPREALHKRGIAFVPEDRKSEGIFPALTTAANMTQSIISRFSRLGILRANAEKNAIHAVSPYVELSPRYLNFKIGNLSGGNQQKALIARALLSGAKILLLFDPTRGVDVGTKEVIYQAIRRFVNEGGAVLVYSSDLLELRALTDRCLVIYQGHIAANLARKEMDEGRMMALMTGHAPAPISGGE
ncbi:sugar ABC transporter ATP-binding protein [Martelella alba]|uniref:Sugar ABC transporter ATP-binding protein n=1 Tax=Martelella alba TaxID=2590451 RepID=A0ABY2SLR1_9HYPH|nr:sugar ABC transporter ATP-binding protein [Martelella alba]TKI05240.1 sugar ABC transporter ATP-binding protein [Martelella alba]